MLPKSGNIYINLCFWGSIFQGRWYSVVLKKRKGGRTVWHSKKGCLVRQERNVTAGVGGTDHTVTGGGAETWYFTEQEIPETESAPQRRHYSQGEWIPKNMPDSQYGKLYLKGSHALSLMECVVFLLQKAV